MDTNFSKRADHGWHGYTDWETTYAISHEWTSLQIVTVRQALMDTNGFAAFKR